MRQRRPEEPTGDPGLTRLALRLAAGLVDEPGDGVWLVELAAVTSKDAVAPTIGAALGLAAQPGQPALETLLDALAPLAVLIVLDNCEHLIGGCATAADAESERPSDSNCRLAAPSMA